MFLLDFAAKFDCRHGMIFLKRIPHVATNHHICEDDVEIPHSCPPDEDVVESQHSYLCDTSISHFMPSWFWNLGSLKS